MDVKQVGTFIGLVALGTLSTAATFGAWGWSRENKDSLAKSSLIAGAVALVAGVATGLTGQYVVSKTGVAGMRGLGLIDVQKRPLGLIDVQRRGNLGLINVQRGMGLINVQRGY